jgi:hypothetical protein
MKGSLPNKGRCPKCTLKPPCKHFDSLDALQRFRGNDSDIPSMTAISGHSHQTPSKSNFYPYKQSDAESSVVSGSTNEILRQGRSDGFSISSHPNKPPSAIK